jgi:putative multiple sugar transport system permease protein
MTNGTLLQPLNITNLILQNSYIVIMALGMLLVIVAGHIDLSVGSVVGFIGALAGVLIVQNGWHFVPASLLCLVLGALIGGAQGWCVAYLKIPSFIVTLAGMLVFRGLTVEFQRISSGFIGNPLGGDGIHLTTLAIAALACVALVALAVRARAARVKHGFEEEPFAFFVARNVVVSGALLFIAYLLASYRGLPNVLIVMAVLIALYTFVTTRTTIGRRIYALGANEKAARLSGIQTERLTLYTFVNMGVLAALAGLIFTARLNSAQPRAGNAFELDVIAACFIGGASAAGGVGAIMGAVIGAFVMGVMNNGMSILGIGIDWQQVIKGLVLLAAVLFDVYNRRKAA